MSARREASAKAPDVLRALFGVSCAGNEGAEQLVDLLVREYARIAGRIATRADLEALAKLFQEASLELFRRAICIHQEPKP